MTNRYFFILNTRIGEKKIALVKEAIDTYFKNQEIDVQQTQYAGHAKILAQEAMEKNYTHVVAVGGDGTVNEVIQIMANSPVHLCIIPCGSGNGLARHCGIPLQIKQATKNILEGKSVSIDLGKVNGVYFISNAGVGIDAVVCNDIKTSKYRGLKMYAYHVAKRFFSYQSDTYKITVNNEASFLQKGYFLNIANGKEFGYGFEIASNASLQDEMLDMIIVKDIHIWNGLGFVIDGWRKNLSNNKHCIYQRAKKIKIESPQLKYFQTDGDAHTCNGICTFEVCTHALHILIPQHTNEI